MRSWSVESVRGWLISRVSELAGLDPVVVDGHERFTRYGLDSRTLTALADELSQVVGRPVPPPLVWRYPSPFALADHLAGGAVEAPKARTPMQGTDDAIAIVGLACRFPKAPGAEEFWRLLTGETNDAVTDLPAGRWSGRVRGGFLDRVDLFDPAFFGISPREAVHVDPQQRLTLELAWEALEDAGIPADGLGGSRTGVFVGGMWNEYGAGIRADPELITQHTLSGGDPSMIPARVSYTFGLRGPSLQVNTACSSSLVAVHLAARSLQDGECDLALACGVSLMLAADTMNALTRFGALASDGRSKAFDARADGYGRGEGAGVVVLKPLARALADGDQVYCVIKGSAVNNDGFSNGLTAPNAQAQEEVLHDAYARAGVAPADVQYVEAHGTGTLLGDPIEAGALSAVLCARRPGERPLAIGSVKSTIGHLEPAAGIAGLIKTVLAMRHRVLPPSAQFEEPNPHIPFQDWRLRVPREPEEWTGAEDGRLLAGVSAFGFGGTNCHVVLEGEAQSPMHLLRLSADTEDDLRDKAHSLVTAEKLPSVDRLYTAEPATQGPHRLALSFRDRDDLTTGAESFLKGHAVPGVASGRSDGEQPKVAFLFGGQGSQWGGMAMRLLQEEPTFRAAIVDCEVAMSPHVDWSLSRLLTSADTDWIESTEHAQPAIFAMQVALVEMWRHWGVEPDAVAGMSMGEVAAAYVAGALRLDEAALIMCRRSRIAHRLTGRGGMAVVELSAEDACELIREHEGMVWPAGSAGPRSTVLSGDRDTLRMILDALAARSVRCGLIRVGYASHCPYVDELLPDLREALAGLSPGPGRIPFYSSVTGKRVDGAELDAEHWLRTEREPWQLTGVIRSLLADGYRVLVDADPHPVLGESIEQHGAVALPSLRRGDRGRTALIDSLGIMHALGVPVRPPQERAGLLVLSGRTRDALHDAASAMADHLSAERDDALHDICYTAGARRPHHEHRLAVVASTRKEMAESLRAAASGAAASAEVHRKETPQAVFLFPGQGSQWAGMGRTLLRDEPVFRGVIEECEELLRPLTGWSLSAELCAPRATSRLDRTEIAQPALFAVETALARLWQSWGITPAAVIGHSVGEIAAAHIAGALPLTEALRLVHHRGLLMGRAPGTGGMAAVEAPAGRVEPMLTRYGGRLAIAAINDPGSVVLSGDTGALAEILERLRHDGVHCRELRVDYAFHSRQMFPAGDELERTLGAVRTVRGELPIYSTVTGEPVGGAVLDAAYWARNTRQSVRFADAVDGAISAGHQMFLEVGAHPVLLENTRLCLSERDVRGDVIGSLRRGEDEHAALRRAAGALHVRGCPVDFERLLGPGRVAALPPYPWQRQRYWLAGMSTSAGHPLLGAGLSSSVDPDTHLWQRELNSARLPYLAGLRVRGKTVLSAAVFVEMALAAAAQAFPAPDIELADLTFEQLLDVDEADAPTAQTVLADRRLQVSSRRGDRWVRHMVATVRPGAGPVRLLESPALIRQRTPTGRDGAEHCRRLAAAGLEAGESLRGVREIWLGQDEVLARVAPVAQEQHHAADYHLHPALLDACLQAVVALCNETAGPHLVTGLGRVRVLRSPLGEVWAHGRLRDDGGDLHLLDDQGRVQVEIEDIRLRPLPAGPDQDRLTAGLYTVAWQRQDLHSPSSQPPGSWVVLAEDGAGDVLAGKLRGLGSQCVVVTPHQADPTDPQSLRTVLEGTAATGVVHMWDQGTASLSALADALRSLGRRDIPRLCLVTRTAQAAGKERHPVSVEQAPLWGLGRAIALEHAELSCCRVDLGPEADEDEDEAAALAAELRHGDRETDVALRSEGRYVARLVNAGLMADRETSLRGDGTYLVVAADNALAESLTEWLTEHGAGTVLVSDGSDEDVAALFSGARGSTASLRGIICAEHRAAWELHQRTLGLPLEMFVLYSSAASLLGCSGEAANSAFLDALAQHRRALGLAGLSVNWAPTELTGMGVEGVTAEEGRRALSRGLGSGLGQLAVMRLNLRQWFESWPSATGTPLLDGLEQTAEEYGSFHERLAAADPTQRRELVEEHLIEQLSLTLRQEPAALDRETAFQSMGLESLMAVELRNRLESTLGMRLSVALLFTYSTIAALASHVQEALGLTGPAPDSGREDESPDLDDWTELEQDIACMSDAEAESLLKESIRLVDEEPNNE
ncbi:acyltransferase domain-containing protein [Streptomyces sp. 3N207]|uniref:acyltransferase domain-containing protein n=1 Tax=Streptomyces sp. 3N207 TaxID=3457417 RepID=UPI003FD11626